MHVLIVPDKFKGTLRADEAAKAIADGWRAVRSNDTVELLPMSDGGDGFGRVLAPMLSAIPRSCATTNAAGESIRVDWWLAADRAIVESASVNGLAMLPAGKFHPFQLDTFGLGVLFNQVAQARPGSTLIVGIGGSATNDGGFGMARALGYTFYDHSGTELTSWTLLDRLERIVPPSLKPAFHEVIIATDVENPLLGPTGATRIYGPQKGITPADIPPAERALERLAQVVRLDLKIDAAEERGAGAAGGLGYGLRVFLQGRFRPGFEIFAELSDLKRKIIQADLIITGEGCIDQSTLMGKGTGAVAALARAHHKPAIGLAGYLPESKSTDLFTALWGIAPHLATIEQAKESPYYWLSQLAQHAARNLAPASAN